MKRLLFILPIILIFFVSCEYNTDKISSLEYENQRLKDSLNKKASLYDSLYKDYWVLRNKMTKHIKYVYTVYDDVIRDEDGSEWDLDEFFTETYTTDQVVSLFDITHEDVENYNPYESDYDSDYDYDDDTHWEPRAP